MGRNYYFFAPFLPPISLQERLELTWDELLAHLSANLSQSDMKKVDVLRLFIDLSNIRLLLMEEPIDLKGRLTEKELDEALLVGAVFPDYVFEFLQQFEKLTDKLRHFSGLLALFFQKEIPHQTGFLKKYLTFEREVRLVLVALRAKQTGRDVVRELQFEESTDPFVLQILAQKDAVTYDPPAEYADLKELIASCYTDPWQELYAFAEYRFQKIAEFAGSKSFTVDQILAYVAQFLLVDSLVELDRERGEMILDTFKNG